MILSQEQKETLFDARSFARRVLAARGIQSEAGKLALIVLELIKIIEPDYVSG